jgi:hypothetical protein
MGIGSVVVKDSNNIKLNVTPTPNQVVQINRGVAGPPGPSAIGGYPIVVSDIKKDDVLMFGVNEWVNTPQTEIADGGNF